MTPTLRIVYDRKKQATKTVPALIQIEIYYKGKRKYVSTGIKVKPDEWDKENRRVKGTSSDFNNNFRIMELWRKIDNFIIDCERRNEEISFTALGLFISGDMNSTESFHQYCYNLIDRKRIASATHRKFTGLIHHLEVFAGLKTFADLTKGNIRKFDLYLTDTGMSKPSIYDRHKQLKTLINEAISDGFIKESPYNGIKIDKGKSKDPVFLTESEMDSIRKYQPTNERLQRVKDLFLFQCLTGMSYSDMAGFSEQNIEQLEGKKIIRSNRNKTDQSFVALLLPEAESIFEKYAGKLPIISNAKYNDYLKLLAGGAEINKTLTTHTARHTFATYLLNKGISISTVSRAIGHAKISTTQHYARLLGKTVVEEMAELLLGK